MKLPNRSKNNKQYTKGPSQKGKVNVEHVGSREHPNGEC